ncbi:unnamed protein product [Rotaria sordida]|uniref:Uncharacterized protein n=1 Tax=Rotaria sordida TaxID=392033 RepID=A0A815LW75_9BILA|nr:unnamed protein product [Rotaria sordida]CAF1411247.1 unnamed protein product [Rotaria sordida]
MNRILMVIRYRKATHIGLRIFKIITINQFDKLDNLNNIWIFIEEDKCNERQQIKQSNVKQRRRYASSSNNNNKNITTSLVTSFLQYLRSELRATTNENNNDYQRIQEKKASETNNCLSQRFYLSNNFSRQQYPIQMSTSSSSSTASSQSLINNSKKLSNKNLLKNTFDNNSTNDDNEILTLINLLILRIECLPNDNTLITEKKNNEQTSKIKEIDQNLIEYLYYLFNKFINEDIDSNTPMVNKTNFVNICQTVVRSGSLNMSSTTSPDQSFSESTFTNDSDQTLIQTSVREYTADINDIAVNNSSLNEQISSASMNDQEAWLIVDLEEIKAERSTTNFDESKCLLSSPTCDDHLLPPNENYFSIEEIKFSESESSHSNYYSPDSSLDDLENMSHEIIEINNNNNNNILLKEEGSSSSSSSSSNEHASNNTNVIIEVKDTTSNDNICTGLTNDCSTNNSSIDSKEQVASSIMETNEQMTMNLNDKTSRRERKMQERWTITTKNNKNTNEQLPTKAFLGVEFPPIAVLRRKFSSSPPSKLNTIPLKKKDYSTVKTKVLLNKNEINNSLQDNINKTNEHISSTPLNRSMSLQNQEINTSTTTNIVDKTKHDHQVLDLQSNDTSSLLICNDSKTNDDIQQSSTIISNLLTDEKILNENMKIETKQDLIEFDNEITTNINHNLDQHEQTNINNNNNSIMISDSIHTNSPSSSSSLLLMSSSSSSSLTTPTNEEKLIELLPNEIEEGKKEEEYFDGGDDNVHVEKKNNFNVEHNSYHTSGIIFINDEPTQAGLLEQEKKEKKRRRKRKRTATTNIRAMQPSTFSR